MAIYQFCTPEWLEESSQIYMANPLIKYKLRNFKAKICCRVNSDPDWGINEDVIFGMFIDRGELKTLKIFAEDEAFQKSEFLMAAIPKEWKKIFRKEHELVADLILDKIKLELGTKIKMLEYSHHMTNIIDMLTQVDLQFPDEMSGHGLLEYQLKMETLRRERSP
jgi:hypothetical protein